MYLAPLAVLALGILTGPILAQSDSTPKPVRVLSHTFTNPSQEFVRVRLVSGERYRVQVDHAPARLEVRPVSPGVQRPRVRPILTGKDLSVFRLEPRVTAEYEIRVLGAGDRPALLTIDRGSGKP